MLDRLRQLIGEYTTRKSFIHLVQLRFGSQSSESAIITLACNVAFKQFKGRYRSTGEPYFEHKLAVAVIIMEYLHTYDAELIMAALLHDLVEDISGWSFDDIQQMFRTKVAKLVDAVTKPEQKQYADQHRFEKAIFAKVRSGGHQAIMLKIADRLHNMITLWGSTEKRQAKILETLRYVLPLAVEKNILWKELTLACAEQQHLINSEATSKAQ